VIDPGVRVKTEVYNLLWTIISGLKNVWRTNDAEDRELTQPSQPLEIEIPWLVDVNLINASKRLGIGVEERLVLKFSPVLVVEQQLSVVDDLVIGAEDTAVLLESKGAARYVLKQRRSFSGRTTTNDYTLLFKQHLVDVAKWDIRPEVK